MVGNPMFGKIIRLRAITAVQHILDSVYSRRLKRYTELRDVLSAMSNGKWTGVGHSDAISLYEAVLNRKPRSILELGAGQSSAVIALAGKISGADISFLAIEESPEWVKHHLEVIPKNLQPLIQLEQRDTAATELDGQPAAYYKDLPRLPYEMVHIDGPDHWKYGASISRDIVGTYCQHSVRHA